MQRIGQLESYFISIGDTLKNKLAFIHNALAQRKEQFQFRELKTVLPIDGVEIEYQGKNIINFSSNDYLGLSQHPLLQERSIEFLQKFGAGSTASRLVVGNYSCFSEVENQLAELKGSEKALILNSGFQANVSIIASLADKNTLILGDKLNHNSLIQGALLSKSKFLRYRHNDLDHLEQLLQKATTENYSRILIVTESVFSMDGDESDIDQLSELSEKYSAFLIVDEAHATGVLGQKGMGLTVGKKVDLTIGTFGKGAGSFGAYVTCSQAVYEYIINFCSGFIYTTALPPSVIGSISASLDLIPTMDQERKHLHEIADFLRVGLQKLGFSTGKSTTQIIPIIVGDEKKTLDLSQWLLEKGVLGMAIRPPTVAKGASRIRIALSSLHTKEHIQRLLTLLEIWNEQTT